LAVFRCRRCRAALTPPLALLADAAALSQREGTSLVPPGRYWPVPAGQDFAGSFAVALADLVGVGYHPDTQRLIGCCGPSGAGGRNRVCECGYEIGTERSDCIWPQAVYLDPSQVLAMDPDAEPHSWTPDCPENNR
jgi:hypothetical protein